MSRLLVRGGTVVDGTGAPGAPADVLVVDGRIAEVGRGSTPPAPRCSTPGARSSPPASSTPTPTSTRRCSGTGPATRCPSTGSPPCSSATARSGWCRCARKVIDELSTLFCYIEDMPREAFATGIPWSWERYPEYRDALADGGLGVHAAVLLGHSALRLYVMGDDAWERAATDDERAAIAGLLDDAVAAGAYGFSTSFFDADARSRPVPSRLADDAERDALLEVLGRHGRGLRRVHPQPRRAGRVRGDGRVRDDVRASRRRQHDQRARAQRVASRVRRSGPGRVPRPAGPGQPAVAPDVAAHHRLPHQLGDVDGVHEPVGVAPDPQRGRRRRARSRCSATPSGAPRRGRSGT